MPFVALRLPTPLVVLALGLAVVGDTRRGHAGGANLRSRRMVPSPDGSSIASRSSSRSPVSRPRPPVGRVRA